MTDGPSNPLLKTGAHDGMAWFANYAAIPRLLIARALGFLGALLIFAGLGAKQEGLTLIASGLSVFGVIATAGVAIVPFILPSSLNPRSSVTVWDSSSSHQTLFITLAVAVIFLPIVLAYTAWVYRILWGKVDEAMVQDEAGHSY